MYPCERLLGLDIPTQDDLCCGWCGMPSATDICSSCQCRYEQEHPDTVWPLIVKIQVVCGLYQGRVVLPDGTYLYTPAHYRRYTDALHAATELLYPTPHGWEPAACPGPRSRDNR